VFTCIGYLSVVDVLCASKHASFLPFLLYQFGLIGIGLGSVIRNRVMVVILIPVGHDACTGMDRSIAL